MQAEAVAADTPLGLLGKLDLGDQRARRRVPPGEVDAGCLPDQAASAIAPDEVLGPQGAVIRQGHLDTGVVLREARHLASTVGRDGQLAHPAGQDALDMALPQPEHVVVPGGKVADVQGDQGEPSSRGPLAVREEPVRDPALVQDLDRA
jgi:hypothetical protein